MDPSIYPSIYPSIHPSPPFPPELLCYPSSRPKFWPAKIQTRKSRRTAKDSLFYAIIMLLDVNAFFCACPVLCLRCFFSYSLVGLLVPPSHVAVRGFWKMSQRSRAVLLANCWRKPRESIPGCVMLAFPPVCHATVWPIGLGEVLRSANKFFGRQIRCWEYARNFGYPDPANRYRSTFLGNRNIWFRSKLKMFVTHSQELKYMYRWWPWKCTLRSRNSNVVLPGVTLNM